jgi:hypothetical protein
MTLLKGCHDEKNEPCPAIILLLATIISGRANFGLNTLVKKSNDLVFEALSQFDFLQQRFNGSETKVLLNHPEPTIQTTSGFI